MHLVITDDETPRKGRFSLAHRLYLVGAGCLCLGWLVPNHYLPWVFFYSDAAAVLGLLLLCLGLGLERHPDAGRMPAVALACAAFMLVPWLQHVTGLVGYAGEAWVAALYLLVVCASLYMGYQAARRGSAELLESVLGAVVAGALLSVLLSVFQWLRLEDRLGIFIANMGVTGRPFANLAQPNLMATLLVMGAVSVAWLHDRSRITGRFAAVLACILAVGMAFAQSRAGYLSAIGVAVWWFWKRRSVTQARLPAWGPLAWLVSVFAFALMLPVLSNAFGLAGDRDVPLFDNNGRWLMWKQVWNGVLAAPWTGYGWGHTGAAQMAGSPGHPGLLVTAYAHNMALDLFAWFGFPLGIAICLVLLLWIGNRATGAQGHTGVFAFALALPVLLHSQFEFPFAYAMFLIPTGFALGMLEAVHARSWTVRAPRVLMAATFGAMAILAYGVGRDYLLAEDDFRIVRFESMRLGKTPATHTRPELPVLTQLDALATVGRLRPQAGMTAAQIDQVRRVALTYPWAPLALKYALVLEANGQADAARTQMQIILDTFGPSYHADALSRMQQLRDELKDNRVDPR